MKYILGVVLLGCSLVVKATTIGYIGCSLQEDAVKGAWRQGDKVLWKVMPYLSGGALNILADDIKGAGNWKSFYDTYASFHTATTPPDGIWWMICAGGDPQNQTYEHALKVIQKINATSLIGWQKIYVSVQPSYNPSTYTCTSDQKDLKLIADRLIMEGYAFPGPELGALSVNNPKQIRDRCHANYDGQQYIGLHLKKFVW
ncbi:MAG: hypothetical protein ACXW2E_00620 [Nitrososphaeraceae archaeon]